MKKIKNLIVTTAMLMLLSISSVKATTVSYGDVNQDGVIDVADAVKIEKYLAKTEELTEQQKLNADVNVDGIVNAVDAKLIKQYLANYNISLSLTTPAVYTYYGDVEHNGKLDVADAVKLEKYLAGIEKLTEQEIKNADINKDGLVNGTDTTILKQMLAGVYPEKSELLQSYDIKVSYGDVNQDGVIDVADAVKIEKYLAKTEDLTSQQQLNADINADGKINETDSTILKKICSGEYKHTNLSQPYVIKEENTNTVANQTPSTDKNEETTNKEDSNVKEETKVQNPDTGLNVKMTLVVVALVGSIILVVLKKKSKFLKI